MQWVFTAGLALSTAVDVLITVSLFVLLQSSRADAPRYDNIALSKINYVLLCIWYHFVLDSLTSVIDTLIRYAFETGSLTW